MSMAARSVAALALLAAALPVPGSAVLAQEGGAAADPGPQIVCLAGSLKDVPQVAAASRGKAFLVAALPGDAAALESYGLVRAACPGGGRMDDPSWVRARDEYCGLASLANVAVQRQLTGAHGAPAAVLCAALEQVAGPWQRPET